MKSNRLIYYAVAILLVLVYYAGEATDLLFLAMFIILPVRYWVMEGIFGSDN